jgi:hypothetical protein
MHISTLFKILNQIKMLHWQTKKHAVHTALGDLYTELDGLVDSYVETHSGKYGFIKIDAPASISIDDISRVDPEGFLGEVAQFLHGDFSKDIQPEKDSDLANIRDEMMAIVNKTRYLLRQD